MFPKLPRQAHIKIIATKPRRLSNRSTFPTIIVSRRKKQPTQATTQTKMWKTRRWRPYDPHPFASAVDDIRSLLFYPPSDSRSSNRNFISTAPRIQLRLHYLECQEFVIPKPLYTPDGTGLIRRQYDAPQGDRRARWHPLLLGSYYVRHRSCTLITWKSCSDKYHAVAVRSD